MRSGSFVFSSFSVDGLLCLAIVSFHIWNCQKRFHGASIEIIPLDPLWKLF